MEIGGSSQDMYSLHALVVFDAPVRQRSRREAQRGDDLPAGERRGLVFGGLLGLLALTWGGLRWAGRSN